jgi:hypothetical protein
MERKKFIESVQKNGRGNIDLPIKGKKCYICGRTAEEFKKEYEIDILEQEYSNNLQEEKGGHLDEIQQANAEFIKAHKREFDTFFTDIKTIPDALNNLSLTEIVKQKGTLVKIYPKLKDLADFPHWRIGHFSIAKPNDTRGRKSRGKGISSQTLGFLKESYEWLMKEFENNNVPTEASRAIVWKYEDRKHPDYLIQLREIKSRVKQIKSDNRFAFPLISRRTQLLKGNTNIWLSYNLCPLCVRLLKS